MKVKNVMVVMLLLFLAGSFYSCSNNTLDSRTDSTNKDEYEIFTRAFYVFSFNREEEDTEFAKDEQCGYLLFEDRGCPGHFHGAFVWAENLPKEYQVDLLPVIATYRYTGKRCLDHRIINIIKIEKQ